MKFVQGSLVKNTLGSQVAEFMANSLSGFVYSFLGAKYGFASSYVVSILGSTLLILYWDNKDYILILIIAAKFGISSAFNMSFIASIELIPALVAASVFGYCNVAARIVTMGSSVVAEIEYPTPLVVSIASASTAAVVSFMLL